MQNQVLTNKIKQFHFNETKLDERFDFYRVKLPEDGSYAQKLSKVKKALNPTSAVYHNAETYYAMLQKGARIKQDDDLAIKPISPTELARDHELVLGRLLVRAIPSLTSDGNSVEADGLYYLVRKRKFKQYDYFVGLNIDFRSVSSPFFCDVVTLKVQTFTPFAMHAESKVSKSPRFEASLFKKLIKRSSRGEYVKRAIPKTKSSVDMLDINGEELSKFKLSKCGFLYQVQQDIARVYGDSFTFELDYSEPGYRIHRSKKFIQEDYQQITDYLNNHGVNICNLSGDQHLTPEVVEQVTKLTCIVPQTSDTPVSTMPNLVLVNSLEYYQEFGLNDPYFQAKSVDPFCQGIIVDKLFFKGKLNKEQLSASLKELVIKQEIKDEKLFLKSLTGRWGFAYVTQKKQGEEFTYHYLEIINRTMHYRTMTPVEWLEYSEMHFDIENKDQHLVIDYDDDGYLLISESELMAIPDYQEIHDQLLTLEQGRQIPIPLTAIQNYMAIIQDSKIKTEQDLLRELDEVVTRNANVSEIGYEELYVIKEEKRRGIAYQGKKQKFYDFLRDEYGIHLKASLKSKDGALSSVLGFFYSPTTECYFAGSHEGAQSTINNFCRLRHVETDYAEIPDKFWQQFDAFYVRHKQSTVLPFAFKYLREFVEISKRHS